MIAFQLKVKENSNSFLKPKRGRMICGISHLMVACLILAIQVRVYILSCLGSKDYVIVDEDSMRLDIM